MTLGKYCASLLLCLLGLLGPKLEVPDYFRLPSLIIMGNYVCGSSHSLSLCVIYFLRQRVHSTAN